MSHDRVTQSTVNRGHPCPPELQEIMTMKRVACVSAAAVILEMFRLILQKHLSACLVNQVNTSPRFSLCIC